MSRKGKKGVRRLAAKAILAIILRILNDKFS